MWVSRGCQHNLNKPETPSGTPEAAGEAGHPEARRESLSLPLGQSPPPATSGTDRSRLFYVSNLPRPPLFFSLKLLLF